MNAPVPHEYEWVSIEKLNAGQNDEITILNQTQ